ncbi:ligand-binding sensor domain-containing protein [Niabella insulamsoli]|uniref:ligand-binding sensor domain-containing protein n=1 Tax=Niabella insulamsoli TaxID=3144874 RepID=UPI0031FCA5D8
MAAQLVIFYYIYDMRANSANAKIMKSVAFILFSLFLGIAETRANDIKFNTLTVDEGLSQHDVSCIIKDSYGFIWIGTYDGLNRFDGHRIKNYFSKTGDVNSLPGNRIKSLFEDAQKRIWVGTDGYGVAYYSLVDEAFFRVAIPPGHNRINSIVEDKQGNIILATSSGLLSIAPHDPKKAVEIPTAPNIKFVNDLALAADGRLVLATNSGVALYTKGAVAYFKGTEGRHYNTIAFDKFGQLWAAQPDGIQKLDLNSKAVIQEIKVGNGVQFRSLCFSKKGDLWAGTINHGLYQINPQTLSVTQNFKSDITRKNTLLTNSVLYLFCDENDLLWAANRKGVCYANLSAKPFSAIDLSSITKAHTPIPIRSLMVKDQKVYFGVRHGGGLYLRHAYGKNCSLKYARGRPSTGF